MDAAFGRRSIVARVAPGLRAPEHGSETERDAAGAPRPADEQKYDLVGDIGSGGMGEVVLVHDRDLRRDVAMKLIRAEYGGDPAMRRRFVAEAQATSQLEHPGIPPVHDIGATPEGRVYFTMKVVRGKTLAQVLKQLLLGAKEARQEFNLHKLVSVMERMSEAVHFAHEKGVVHRDLKPENVMLGEFGEVHVMDWGLAKVAAEDDEAAEAGVVDTVESHGAPATQAGVIKGTIPYMSPEQARGAPLDRRTDVYSLGAILYEMLTLHPAFAGEGVPLLLKVRAGEFPDVSNRNPRRPVPEALAELCRRAMAKDPAARPATAREFGDALRRYLDGRAERERRRRQADALVEEARRTASSHAEAKEAIAAAERDAAGMADAFRPWQGVDETAPFLEARERVARLRDDAASAFADAANLYGAALVADPEHADARAALADMWRDRLDDAERCRAREDAAFALRMVRRLDDGRLSAYVAGDGSLELTSEPPGAEVVIARFEDRHGVLRPEAPRRLGATPLARIQLAMGSYLCTLTLPGCSDVHYPVHVTRNRAWTGRVRMRSRDEIGDEFAYVPGGPFVYGEGVETRIAELPDFAIARRPVTLADWAEFLSAVEQEDGPDAARKLVPHVRGDGDYMERRSDGRWVPLPINCEGAARERCLRTHGPDFEIRLPVAGVSWHHAVAWCEWKTRTTGREWRLPTEEEREKAARGVDGRRFPWGDLQNATLGRCRDSRDEVAQPEPVGSFPHATSVYGVVDAAGNSFDWTDSWFDARAATRAIRGGSWSFPPEYLRCAFRYSARPESQLANNGFRPARSFAN